MANELQHVEAVISPEQVTMDDLMERFLKSQDVKPSSVATYRRQLRRFFAWLEDTGRIDHLNALTREDILSYRSFLQEELRLSSYTVNGYITVVRKFFAWLEANGVYRNIAGAVKGLKKARGFRKDCLTREQIRRALASIDRTTLKGKRDYAIFNLLVRTGLRTVEVARANIGDLRQEAGQAVLWVQGKGRDAKDDFVVLTDEALQPIYEYLSARKEWNDDAPLFASISNRSKNERMTTRSISRLVKEILRGIGLDSKRLTAHSLRHTSVTLAIEGGASLQQAQAMARHSDPKTTMIYFHNLNRISDGAEKFIKI